MRVGIIYSYNLAIVMSSKDNSGTGQIGGSGGTSEPQATGTSEKKEEMVKR